MGISYNATTATITVTGGSYTEPFSMADIIAHGTAGAYVATGGYGGREATVSANLVIGSTTGSTFYDPTGYITKEASGFKLTVYHHSLRCAKMSDTWASRTFGDAIPATDVRDRMLRSEVLMMYVKEEGFISPQTGALASTTPLEVRPNIPELGATLPLPGGEPEPLPGQTQWDPCAMLRLRRLTEGIFEPENFGAEFPAEPERVFSDWPQTAPATTEPVQMATEIKRTVVLVRSNDQVVPD